MGNPVTQVEKTVNSNNCNCRIKKYIQAYILFAIYYVKMNIIHLENKIQQKI